MQTIPTAYTVLLLIGQMSAISNNNINGKIQFQKSLRSKLEKLEQNVKKSNVISPRTKRLLISNISKRNSKIGSTTTKKESSSMKFSLPFFKKVESTQKQDAVIFNNVAKKIQSYEFRLANLASSAINNNQKNGLKQQLKNDVTSNVSISEGRLLEQIQSIQF